MEPRVLMAATPALGVGTGLIANYFSGETLENLAVTRKDATVNFEWSSRSPGTDIPADHFSARWIGKVQPQFTEPYTFHVVSDGGVRLWVNGESIVDNWADHTLASEDVGTIELRAGELYDIKLEYRETTGNAVAKLLWSSPSTEAAVIPSTQLYGVGAGWLSGGWLNQDVGGPSRKGSVKSTGSVYTVQGSGASRTGGTSDQSHYVYQTLNGDGSITARLTGVSGGTTTGRVGLMFRESLDDNAAFASLSFTPAAGAAIADADSDTHPVALFSYRPRRGVRTLTPPATVPAGEWVRLVRDGNSFRAYTSATGGDGTWEFAGTALVPTGRTVYVGLSVNSGDAARLSTASFSNVSLRPTVPLGAGVDSLRDWNLGNVFVDLVRQTRAWQTPDMKNPFVAADSAGWPTADFGTIFQSGFEGTGHVYKGTYRITFTGQATLGRWNTPGRVVAQSYNPKTNVTTADFLLDPPEDGGWYFGVNFTDTRRTPDSPVGSGITNLKVIQPGYSPDTTQVFTDEYLKHLEQFSVLRMMSFTNTNNNQVVKWADRAKPDEPRQSTSKGVAWEYAIDLANLTGKDLWVNVPGRASDDYVRNMAELFKERLDPGRVVYVEYSNEVWNYQFDQAQYNLAQAKAEVAAGGSNLNNDGSTSSAAWAFRRHGRRTKEIGEIFASVFGPGSLNGRVRPVLGAQAANSDTVRLPLPWLARTYGDPSDYLYAVAVAPYFTADGRDQAPGVTSEEILEGLANSVRKRNFRHPMFTGLAARYGLRSFAYEGGSATGGEQGLDAKLEALRDPRTRQITADYLNGWYSSGGELFEWFMAGPTNWTSPFGAWGLTDALDNFDSPKLLGTIDVATGPKVAQSAGVMIPGQVDARYHTNDVASDLGAASPDPYVRYVGAGSELDYIVRAPVAGTYYLRVSAATPSGGKTIDVYVNQDSRRVLTVPSNGTTNSFDKFVDTPAVALPMREGINLVRLVVPSQRPYNIESLKFATSPDGLVGDTMPVLGGMAFPTGNTIVSNATFGGAFTLADDQTPADSFVLEATSDNDDLLPDGSFTFTGSNGSRTLRVAPAADLAGTANVFLSVTDSAGQKRSVQFTRLTVRPAAPAGPKATALGPDQIELAWTDASTNETGFRIERSLTSDFKAFDTITTAAGATRYVVTGLNPETRYYFRLRSVAPAAGTGGTIESSNSSPVNAQTTDRLPTIATPAAASPGNVTGTATTLTVLGADDKGENLLTYTWRVLSAPAGLPAAQLPTFSANGTNAAKSAVVTFFAPGAYTFGVTVTDAGGKTVTDDVDVTVTQTLARVEVAPKTATLDPGNTLKFSATAKDQFGTTLPDAAFTWSATGGKISATTGDFTAPAAGGSVTVTATSTNGVKGTAQVTVNPPPNQAPTVIRPASADPNPVTGTTATLAVVAGDDGGAANLRYTWSAVDGPAGVASPVFSANGTSAAATTVATFAGPGLYDLRVTISDGSLSVTSAVSVDVRSTPTSVSVTPGTVTLAPGGRAQFSAVASDQFGQPLATQPPLQWSVDGDGSVDPTGAYTAAAFPGSARVVATAPLYSLSGAASVTVSAAPNEAPALVGEDVGPVALAGSDSVSRDGTYTVTASGSDIFSAPDSFRFLHRSVTGDVSLVARVATLQNVDPWAKAGVMIREGTGPDARFAYAVVTPGNGASFGRRTTLGGDGGSTNLAGPKAPTWVRLTRSGTSFSAFSSADGQAWTQIGTARTISMASTVEVGLCLVSHVQTRLVTATFDGVSVTPATDLAYRRPVTASSAVPDLEVANAVDGSGGTRWESRPDVSPAAQQWVRVDLGGTKAVRRVRLNWAGAYASGYKVQVSSDDATWSDVYSTTSGDGNVDDLLNLSATGRFVRVIADTPSTPAGPIAINDFNVYS